MFNGVVQNHWVNKIAFSLSVVACLVFFDYALAQEDGFEASFYYLNEDGEIPSTEVYSVFQDSKGNMWFCSDAGATRYDGYYYKTFTEKDGLTSNIVFNVVEDRKGRIWFLTLTPQLCYLENEKIHEYEYNDIIDQVGRGNPGLFADAYLDEDDNLYYSLKGAGTIKIKPTGEFSQIHEKDGTIQITKIEDTYLSSIRIDAKKGVMPKKGADRWVFPVFHGEPGSLREIGVGDPNGHFQANNQEVSNRNLFTIGGRLRSSDGYINGIEDVLFVNIDRIDKDVVWVGTRNNLQKGRIEKNNFILEEKFLDGLSVTSICWDNEGSGWFSTLNSGVLYCNNFDILRAVDLDGVVDKVISGVTTIDGKLFYTSGPYCHQLSSNEEYELAYSSQGKLDKWRGSVVISGAYWRLQSKNGIVGLPFLRDFQIQGNSIYGVSSRVYKYNLESLKIDTLYDATRDTSQYRKLFFRAIQVLDDGKVIIGGPSGLSQVKDLKLIRNFLNTERLGLDVSDVLYDPRWGLIVATCNKGVFVFNEGKKTLIIDEDAGLISDNVSCLSICEDGMLLIGTNYGLNYISANSGEIGLLSKNLGLETQDVNTIYTSDEFVYIGTKKGLFKTRLDQLKLKETQVGIRVFLDGAFVNGKKVNPGSKLLTLGSDVNVLRLRFRVNSYKNWFNKKYQYRLSPGDDWIDISSPEIVLYRPSGTLIVEVRYNDENNHWSKPFLLLDVDVKLPIWKRWYFWLACMIFVSGGIIFWFRRRQRIVERELQLKNELLSLEQRMHSARMNPHFIFNVLNSIQGFMLFNENELAEKYLVKFSTLMRKVLDTSSDGQIYLNDEIEIIDKYLELEKLRSSGSFEYDLIAPKELKNALIPTMLIQPIIENAVIHGVDNQQSSGKIVVKFEKAAANALKVIVFNNKEIGDDQLDKILTSTNSNAIGLTKSRLQNFCHLTGVDQYRIEVQRNYEEIPGTTVIVVLPILMTRT